MTSDRTYWLRAMEVPNVLEEFSLIPGLMLYDDAWARWMCPCNCGKIVLIPLDSEQPGQRWRMTINDSNVPTVQPSINQTGYECKSHYFINDGHVQWC